MSLHGPQRIPTLTQSPVPNLKPHVQPLILTHTPGVSAQEPSTLPLVDMDAGDILMYHGHQHFHGCRGLVEGERRLQMSLFYKTVVQLPQGKGTYGAQAESGREL